MKRAALSLALVFALIGNLWASSIALTGAGAQGSAFVPIGTATTLGGAVSSGTTTTTTMNYSASLPAGALLVVVASNSNLLTYSAISDSCSNTLTAITASGNNGANSDVVAIWYKENANACASGQTLTATTSAGTANRTVSAAYVTGILTSSSLDKSANGTSAVGTPSISTGVLSQTNEIIFGGTTSNGTITPVSGFSQVNTATPPNTDMETKTVAATTSVTYNPTTASSGAGVVVASFKGN